MPTIGIIANPASGKDIRRLVSYATTIDNREKVNIVKRITLAAQSMGIDRILFMPDTFQIGRTVMADLARDGLLEAELCVCDIADLLGLTQSAISHQLRILKSGKLVKFRRDGKTVYYSLADDHVVNILCQGLEHIEE